MDIFKEHAALVCDWFGEERGIVSLRKWATWYTKSFPGGAALRERFVRIKTLDELIAHADSVDRDTPFPPAAMRAKRGKRSGTQKVHLPDGYLDDREDDSLPSAEAESETSGG